MKNRLESLLPGLSNRGFGSWALGGEYWGEQDHKDSVRALHRALALGINHFDTAPVYGKGRSEQLIGQQMKKNRYSVYLASKVFYSTPEKMKRSLDTSLKRMLTDYLDIFYIHWPLGGADMRPGMEMLEDARKEGKIRAIGVSNFSLEDMRSLEEAGRIDVYQGGYSLFWPILEDEILPYLKEKGIAFIPYGVLAQGILTDRGEAVLQKEQPGFRHKMVLFSEDLRRPLTVLSGNLRTAAASEEMTLEELAAAYAARKTEACSVLLGCRNRRQADLNFGKDLPFVPPPLMDLCEEISGKVRGLLPPFPNMFNHKS